MNNENLRKIRHTCEHVFNQAIEELYPGKVLRAMGPATDEGWYNDSRWLIEISEEMFPLIEKKMQQIINKNLPLVYKEITEQEAKKLFKHNPFKIEFINEFLKEGKKLSVYYTGDPEKEQDVFVDLCAGPHASFTGEIKAFKLLSVAGAYWRGDEKNEMLTRVYGTAFETKEDLNSYLKKLEEAKERDHRKIGKEQNLFVFSEVVGKGLPLWTERGSIIRRELERFIVDEEIARGYLHVYTPDIAKVDLYRTSGHYPYYKDSMYSPIVIDDEEFMLRPMTCPHHFELFKSIPRSYKELPMRIAELAKLYRYEQSGELSGLIRVRSFCLADAHIIAPKINAKDEINGALDLIEFVSKTFGLRPNEDYWYRLSLGDRKDEKKYFKDDKAWDEAESILREVLATRDVKNFEASGEAAFYGPKIDIQMKNVNGKEDTAFTVQYDFVMPKRFKLEFINASGEAEEPIVIHRSSVGAIERVIGFLIERFKGSFPLWLHPEQVAIVPISEKQNNYAKKIVEDIKQVLPSVRIKIFDEADRMQKRIRDAQIMKIPYILVVGAREEESRAVNVRLRTEEQLGEMTIEDFAQKLKDKVLSKSLDLPFS